MKMKLVSPVILFVIIVWIGESQTSIVPREGLGENVITRFRRMSCVSNDGPCPTEKDSKCCNICSKTSHKCENDDSKRFIDEINTHG